MLYETVKTHFLKKKIFPKNQQNLVADDRISREKKIIDTFNSYSSNIVQGLFTLIKLYLREK